MYPLALGIDVSGDDFVISYGMPDLPEATGQGKEEENTDRSVLTLRGRDFDEIQQLYDRSQNRYLDIGHLEVIIMGNEMLESGRWEDVFELSESGAAGRRRYLSFQNRGSGGCLEMGQWRCLDWRLSDRAS